jgi:DNA-binding XRE family transcriptional regulator
MLLTGNQIKAARALVEVDQQQLADAASVHVNTIRNMEAKGRGEITSAAPVLRRVQTALEHLGVEFINGERPGVRMRESGAAPVAPVGGARKRAVKPKTTSRGKHRPRP